MPLIHSARKEAVGQNISILSHEKYPHDQAVAIALEIQRRARGETAKAEPQYSMSAKEAMQEHLRLLAEIAGIPGFEKEFKDQAEELPKIEDALTKALRQEPSENQIKSGNYFKPHVRVHGLPISIENPMGSIRRGVDDKGEAWAIKLPYHYGYIRNHNGNDLTGGDGDHLDVCIGPIGEESDEAHIVNQLDPETGAFDEAKVMIGFPTREAAIEAFKLGRSDDPEAVLGEVITVPIEEFKRWICEGKIKGKAVLKAY
jgi:hypothetical protein